MVKFSVSFSHLGKKPEGWSTEKGIQRTPSPRTIADSRERHSSKQEHEWQSAHRTVRTRGPLFVDSKNRHLRDSLPLIQGNRMYPEKRSLNPDTQCLFLHSIYKHYTLTKVSSWVSHSMLISPVSSPLIQNDPTPKWSIFSNIIFSSKIDKKHWKQASHKKNLDQNKLTKRYQDSEGRKRWTLVNDKIHPWKRTGCQILQGAGNRLECITFENMILGIIYLTGGKSK